MARIEVTNAWGQGIDMRSWVNGPYSTEGYGLIPAYSLSSASFGTGYELGSAVLTDPVKFDNFDAMRVDYEVWANGFEGTFYIENIYYLQGSNVVYKLEDLNFGTVPHDHGDTTWRIAFTHGDDEFYGNDFADFIVAGYGYDLIYGGGGDDYLSGGYGHDTIFGGSGNDTLQGGREADVLQGGLGDDTYYFEDLEDSLSDEGGIDIVVARWDIALPDGIENLVQDQNHSKHWHAIGNSLDNRIEGGWMQDTLEGSIGDDTLIGSGGNDTLIGGLGNDTAVYLGSRDAYTVTVNVDGSATVRANSDVWNDERTDTLVGIQYVQFTDVVLTLPVDPLPRPDPRPGHIYGDDNDNKLTGDSKNNVLKGFSGDDVLKGAGGNDRVFGGLGNDTLYGGAGKDTFYFDTAPNGSTNVDSIRDFNIKADAIRFSNAEFSKVGRDGSLKASAFWIGSKAHDTSDRVIYNKVTGSLFYDPDGTGVAEQIKVATLDPKLALTWKDIFIF